MRITFNAMNCGLGNNGGSMTIVKSANALVDLGHNVKIVDTGRNHHTWTPLKATHIRVKSPADIPSGDVIIATGYDTVRPTMVAMKHCGKKVHWIRAWELWRMTKEQIIKKVLGPPTFKVVNSFCLKRHLSHFGFSSEIIRPGHDFDELYPTNLRRDHQVVLGGLYNEGSKRKWKNTPWIFATYKKLQSKFSNIRLFMFGSDGRPEDDVNIYLKNPPLDEKNKLYNVIDIWLAPTELEGLHIAPAEAMLTECCVLGTFTPMSGMQDYLQHNKTGFVSADDPIEFWEAAEILVKDESLRKRLGTEGRKKVLSLGDRKENMQKFVELLESI